MNDIKISFDSLGGYDSKPEERDVGNISNRVAKIVRHLNTDNIKDHVEYISADGHTFCPATFRDGRRRKESFEQMQLFVLDFDNAETDNKVSFEDVKDRAEKHNLPILFAYETFTSKDKDRFRVVFQNDVPITATRDAEVIQNALVTIFPECDKASKDITHMYYGGKKDTPLFFDNALPKINVVSAITGMTGYLEERYGKNYRRQVAEFTGANHLSTNDRGMPDISVTYDNPPTRENAEIVGAVPHEENSPNSTTSNNISIIEGFGENSSKLFYLIKYDDGTSSSAQKKTLKNHSEFRSKDIPQLRSACQLLLEFESGSRRLGHDELFGLATNLVNVETERTLFLESFSKNSIVDDRVGKYSYWEHQLKNYISGYKPQSCDSFCKHSGTCSHGTNILSTSKLKYHQMDRLAGCNEHLCELDEAEKDFKQAFTNAMNDPRKLWFIIKAQTAIGKTQTYLELIRDTSLRVLIVVPTNKLKSEIGKIRAAQLGIKLKESPSLREIKDDIPSDVWEHIEYLYTSGKSVIPYLKKLIKEDDPEYSKLFKQYLKELNEFKDYDGHAITTHKRFLTMDVSKYDLVVIDEDILLGSIIQNKTDVSVSELKKLKKETAPGSAVWKKINKALKHVKADAKESEFFEMSTIEYDKADDDIAIGVDIPSFCAASRFLRRRASDKENNVREDCVTFIKPVDFKSDTKYIMVSATVDETVCNLYFGEDRVEFCECKKARLEGKLNLIYDKPMSRACIDSDTSVIDRITRWSGFKHLITFKKYRRGDLHFGNTEGCDFLKGKNIDVIGTPHQPDWIYKLFAYSIGAKFDTEAKIKPGLTVEHNGYRFRFTTYEDEVLRAIQFYVMESQLEQAVGRARLLRCDCTVNLYSNFPLSQVRLIKSEYDDHTDDDGTVEVERKEPV